MVIEKTYKLVIQGRSFTLTEAEIKALYLSLKDSFKEVDVTVSEPSQASQLPSES